MSLKPLFVYGTLRHKQRNSVYHGLSGSCDVTENVVLPGYNLHHLGGFPGVVPGENSVVGDVFMVPDNLWNSLDSYEGVPHLYTREEVNITGFDVPVNVYVYNGDLSRYPLITNGDWLNPDES